MSLNILVYQPKQELRFDESTELQVPTLEQIWQLQEAVSTLEQIEFPTKHWFADGVYAREMFIPRGCILVGKVHKREHMFQIVSGKMALWSESQAKVVKAPFFVVSQPGIKRVGYALEDTVCINFHRTDKTDIEEIEEELVEQDDTALLDAYNRPVLRLVKKEE